jgi:hypothetical protein
MQNMILGILLLLLATTSVCAQEAGIAAVEKQSGGLLAAEDSLKTLAISIVEPLSDSGRLENNRHFYAEFARILETKESFSHPFDSLQTVSMLMSPDSLFRIITWYVPLQGQRFEYFGMIQMVRSEGQGESANGKVLLTHLRDSTSFIRSAVFSELSPERWFGAYYYEIIHQRVGETDLYTMLGWKGDNPHTRKRVIEPLWFREGKAIFGKQVFRIGQRDPFRIVFEYSALSSMSLLFDAHPIRSGQPPSEMIVFDRLSPGDESLRGHYRFYLPEANIFDALIFENGQWVFYPDVDARAPEPEAAEEG